MTLKNVPEVYLSFKEDIDLIRRGLRTVKIMLQDLEDRFEEVYDNYNRLPRFHRINKKYGYREHDESSNTGVL